MISIENLSYRVGTANILNDVSVSLPKSGMTALIGPNGAGKSSLLSHVARLLPLQTGTIRVDDLEVGQCDNAELARRIAILPQQVQFATRLTVRDMIAFGRYPYSQGRLGREDHKMIDASISAFNLELLENRFLDTLSGGQRHKAHVAMTFAQDTDYLLLDEPLNNLDIEAARALMALLRDLVANAGKTIVIVVHDINFAAQYADHLVVMKDGKAVISGRPSDLITETLLRDVFSTDAKVASINGKVFVLP